MISFPDNSYDDGCSCTSLRSPGGLVNSCLFRILGFHVEPLKETPISNSKMADVFMFYRLK